MFRINSIIVPGWWGSLQQLTLILAFSFATTVPVLAQGPGTVYFEQFSGESFPDGWSRIGSNSTYFWNVVQGINSREGQPQKSAMRIEKKTSGDDRNLNVWAFTPGIKLQPGIIYNISFYSLNRSIGSAYLNLVINSVQGPDRATQIAAPVLVNKNRWEEHEYRVPITVKTEGTYYLGFGITRLTNDIDLHLDEVRVTAGLGPLNGVYNVGLDGHFVKPETAVYNLLTRGISGPVTFNHTNAAYYLETGNKLSVAPFTGMGTYPVTFKSATPGSATFFGSSDKESMIYLNTVNNIHLNGLKINNSSPKTPWGVSLTKSTNCSVAGCIISAGSETGNVGARGISVEGGQNNTLVNNMVHSVLGTGLDITATLTDNLLGNLYGLVIDGGADHKVYNNSVSITGQRSVSGSVSAALAVGVGTTGLDVRNNILANTQTKTAAAGNLTNYALYSLADRNAFAHLNYNLYYTAAADIQNYLGFMANVGSASRLQDWKSASLTDYSSMFGQPAFASNTDLTILATNARSWFTNGTGVQLPVVPKDMKNNNRSVLVATGGVDLGALEFTPTAVAPDMVVLGTRAPGQRQVFTFAEREMAAVTWAATATSIPVNFNIKYRPGQFVTNYPTGYLEATHMNSWMEIINGQQGSPATYSYTFEMFYDESLLGELEEKALNFTLTQKDAPLADWFGLEGIWYDFAENKLTKSNIETVAYVVGSDKSNQRRGVLPVELLHFSATATPDNLVKLYWATATEKNNDYYIIERSLDGQDFIRIGKVKGAGTTVRATDYRFTDSNPLTGTSYYRLQQINFDGTFEYLPVRAVTRKGTQTLVLTLYPNPAQSSEVHLQLQGMRAGEEARLLVTDVMGKAVLQKKVQNPSEVIIAAGELAPGTYLVKVILKAGSVTSKLILK